jgi:hypothetical protein
MNFQGNYSIYDYIPSIKNFPDVVIQNGEYKSVQTFSKNGEDIVDWEIYFSILRV